MTSSNSVLDNDELLQRVKKWAAEGESLYTEFKRKVAFPEKVIREMIAFANTSGGRLLIGVDDDGSLPGVKYPDEEIHVLQEALKQHCRPTLTVTYHTVALSKKKFIVIAEIARSEQRPHRLVESGQPPVVYVRVDDMSVKASREMQEIVRRSKQKKDIRFVYGPPESALMKFLSDHETISLAQFAKLTKLNRFRASRKLVTLVLANVLRIMPGQPDRYSRVG